MATIEALLGGSMLPAPFDILPLFHLYDGKVDGSLHTYNNNLEALCNLHVGNAFISESVWQEQTSTTLL